jgi:acetyl esterase/lipase
MKTHSYVIRLLALLGLATAAPAETAQPLATSIVQEFAIWPGQAPDMQNPPAAEKVDSEAGNRSYSAISRPTVTAFFASNPNGAAVLVLPGGGYNKIVFDKEGSEIARWLNALGIDAFVLKYRLLSEAHNTSPSVGLEDAQRAMRTIRAGHLSGNYGHKADAKRIGVIGFSAGGNLAAVLGTYHGEKTYAPVDEIDAFSARPDFMILGYAWVPAKGEVQASNTFPAAHIFADAVSADTPPAFVFTGDSDKRVPPLHSERAAQTLKAAGVPAELQVFAGADHGFALRGTGPEKAWPDLCAAWLRARGFLPPEVPDAP